MACSPSAIRSAFSSSRPSADERLADRHDPQQRGPPVGDARQVVDEPAQGRLHLLEGADHHHQPAERHAALEVARRGDQDRHDERAPAVAGGDPGQTGEPARQVAHDVDERLDRAVERPALVRLAAVERDRLRVLVGPHQAEPQRRLAGVALAVEPDQRPADAPGEVGAAEGVNERAPDHVARDREAAAAQRERHLAGEAPEHPDEADQEERGLQAADAEVGREVGEVAGVLLHPLVGVDADLAGVGEQAGAPGCEPLVEQVAGEPGPQAVADRLLQPGLGDHHAEQHAITATNMLSVPAKPGTSRRPIAS